MSGVPSALAVFLSDRIAKGLLDGHANAVVVVETVVVVVVMLVVIAGVDDDVDERDDEVDVLAVVEADVAAEVVEEEVFAVVLAEVERVVLITSLEVVVEISFVVYPCWLAVSPGGRNFSQLTVVQDFVVVVVALDVVVIFGPIGALQALS